MTDDSLELLWRGSDPAKFTALQAALRDEEIRFWHTQVYDPAGGFLSSRPYYLEATPGFEIRVRAFDLVRANAALYWVENKENNSENRPRSSADERDPLDSRQRLPHAWNASDASAEAWTGEEEALAEYLASALRENGIPSRIADEPGHRARLCVRPEDVQRAREIVAQIVDSAPPA
jgi:hypothetical protein